MALVAEAQLEAVVDDALVLQPLGEPHGAQQVDRALLQHARPHALLHVLARTVLEDHRLDPALVQQMRENEARGTCSDDSHLRAHQGRGSGRSPMLIRLAYYLVYTARWRPAVLSEDGAPFRTVTSGMAQYSIKDLTFWFVCDGA